MQQIWKQNNLSPTVVSFDTVVRSIGQMVKNNVGDSYFSVSHP